MGFEDTTVSLKSCSVLLYFYSPILEDQVVEMAVRALFSEVKPPKSGLILHPPDGTVRLGNVSLGFVNGSSADISRSAAEMRTTVETKLGQRQAVYKTELGRFVPVNSKRRRWGNQKRCFHGSMGTFLAEDQVQSC